MIRPSGKQVKINLQVTYALVQLIRDGDGDELLPHLEERGLELQKMADLPLHRRLCTRAVSLMSNLVFS